MEEANMEKILSVANAAFEVILNGFIDENGDARPIDLMCVTAIIYRQIFANVEREVGLEKAREVMGNMKKLVEMTLEEGAWDEVEQRMK